MARLAFGTASALGLARFAYGLILPAMRSELGWSLAQAGGLTTANAVGYLIGAVAVAHVTRRLTLTATFRLGMVLTAATLAATAITGSYPVLLLTRAAAGLAGALVFITGGVIASHNAASSRSAAPLAIYFSGAGLGIAASGAAIPVLLGHDPGRWQVGWVGLGAAGCLATVISWTAARGSYDNGAASTLAGARTVLRLWQPAVAYLLFAGGYIAYITFLSAYLTSRHASVAQITLTWTVLGLAAVVSAALWSRPIGTWPRASALAVLLAILSAAAVAALAGGPLAVTGSALGYGATFLAVPAAVTGLIRTATQPGEWTGALAAFTVVFAAGQIAGPYLSGALADRYGTDVILVWTAALCAAGSVLSGLTRDARRGSPAGPLG
jgi:predicted MFS family arabinose efflux permease